MSDEMLNNETQLFTEGPPSLDSIIEEVKEFEQAPAAEYPQMPEESAPMEEIPEEPVVVQPQPVFQPAPVAPPAPVRPQQPVYQQPQPAYQPQPVYQQQPVYQYAPEPEPHGKKAKRKHHLPLGVRILLRILTFLLCFVLTVSLTATILLLDLNALTSKVTLEKATGELLTAPPVEILPGQSSVDEEEIAINAEDLLVDMIYEGLSSQPDAENIPPKEEIADFVNDSSVPDFLIGKVSSYVDDFIRGTNNTQITTEEIEDILDESEALIEDNFDVEMDDTVRQEVIDYIEENDINTVIQDQVLGEVRNTVIGGTDFTVDEMLAQIRFLFSPSTIILMLLLDALLAVMIYFTKQLQLGGTLVTLGGHVLSVGLLGSIPVFIYQFFPEILAIEGVGGLVTRVIGVFVNAITPIHYTFMIVGVALIILGVVFKLLLRPKKVFA